MASWVCAKYRATTGSELAGSTGECSVEVGPSWSSAKGTISAAAVAVVESAGEARPPGFVKYSAMSESESELAESSVEASSFDEDEGARWITKRVEAVKICGKWQYFLWKGRDSEERSALR